MKTDHKNIAFRLAINVLGGCLTVAMVLVMPVAAQAGMFFDKPISFSGNEDPGEIIGVRRIKKEEPKHTKVEKPVEPEKPVATKQPAPAKQEPKTEEEELFELFAETTIDAEGKQSIRVPPKIFREFMKPENRNKEYARRVYYGLLKKAEIHKELSKLIQEVAAEKKTREKRAEIRMIENTSGKPLVLSILSPTCQYCLQQVSALKSLYKKWGDRVDFSAILVNSSKRDAINFITQYRVPFKLDPDLAGLARKLKVKTFPTTFIISRKLNKPVRKVGLANARLMNDILARLHKGQQFAPKVHESGIILNSGALNTLIKDDYPTGN
jgi:thiol-disulfide isomerase/thioredoxin